MPRALQWDIFCRVIDNHGDLGVCWRLSRDLASRGQRVRLWVDEPRALSWMAPQGAPGVQLRPWQEAQTLTEAPEHATQVMVEAFGCEIPAAFVAATVQAQRGRPGHAPAPAWINLEYLSAEPYVERNHALPSPVLLGPAAGWTKHFFYPGFTPRTGGLLRERDLLTRQASFDAPAWLASQGVAAAADTVQASLFSYEPAALPGLLTHWRQAGHHGRPVNLLVTAGRAWAAVQACGLPLAEEGLLRIHPLPYLSQLDFDHLLWACDINLVRGEDSLARALWAGKPLVWQLYPQDDGAHEDKLRAFLDMSKPPPCAQAWHAAWNPVQTLGAPALPVPYPDAQAWAHWQAQALDLRDRLLAQDDLASQLISFVDKSV